MLSSTNNKLDNCKKFWTVRFFLILVAGSLIGAVSSNTLEMNKHPHSKTLKTLEQNDKTLERKIKSNTEKINRLERIVNQ